MKFSLLFLAVVFLAACDKQLSQVEAGPDTQALHVGNGPEPASIDPQVVSGVSEMRIVRALFEGLVTPAPQTLEPQPGVASSWTVSDNRRTWTFHLRDDARWSDGQPVTAADFALAWRRALRPSLAAPYASSLFVIEGAEAYFRGVTDDFADVGIRIRNQHTLEVTLTNPTPHFLRLLDLPVFLPVPAHILASRDDALTRATDWTEPGVFVSNGPFRLADWTVNSTLTIEKNQAYWNAGYVRLNRVVFHALTDKAAEERAYRAGQLHITDSVPTALVPTYRAQRSDELYLHPYLGTFYVLLNVTQPPLDDPHVREALSLALDRRSLVEDVLQGGQLPATRWTPPGLPGYQPTAGITENATRARELLTLAGFPEGRGFPALTYLFNQSENQRVIAESLQAMWRETLGITIELQAIEWRVYLDRRRTGDFQLARGSWIGDYLDPKTFLDLWTTDSTRNWTRWSNPAYDAAIDQAARSDDSDARRDAFTTAEAILLRDLPILPLYFYTNVYLLHPTVRGWHPNLLDRHPLQHVWLEE